jgi:hypothetical protein
LRARPPFRAAFRPPRARAFDALRFGRAFARALRFALGRARFFAPPLFFGREARRAGAGRLAGSSLGIESEGSISGGIGDGISIVSSVIDGSVARLTLHSAYRLRKRNFGSSWK